MAFAGPQESAMKDTRVARRIFLGALLAAPILILVNKIRAGEGADETAETTSKGGQTVTVIKFTDAGERVGPVTVNKVVKPDSEWKKELNPEQFQVTRRAGTERAGTGKYAYNHDHGIYRCVCCGNALFSSDTKFESGTGWPSFWQPIAEENVEKKSDQLMVDGARRGAVPRMRRAPGACLPRRSATHRSALLHELGRAELRQEDLGPKEIGRTSLPAHSRARDHLTL